MQAAAYAKYGPADVVTIRDIPRPEPRDNEVLVQVFATSVTTADWRLRASDFPGFFWLPGRLMYGLLRPKNPVLGMEFAGRIVAKGKAVTRFKGGDSVFGIVPGGAHAEYLTVSQDGAIVPIPDGFDFEQAAAVPFGALSALVFLRDYALVKPGQRVLILGASGGVGVLAVQLAKAMGADVTGVTSTGNVDLVRSLGADQVIDYTTTDFAATGDTWDAILDTAGVTGFADARRVLTPKGVFVPLEFGLREAVQALITALGRGPKVRIGVSGDTQADLRYIADLMASGALRPVIDSRYPLHRIVQAHARVESRHKTGSVVVTVDAGAA